MVTIKITPGYPSIQSFYKREVTDENGSPQTEPAKQGDGFTEDELADAFDPLSRKWNPEREYEELPIYQLIPGPRAVSFAGRIANITTASGRSQKQPKASGWHHLIIKDDSAAIAIKLFFASNPYPLKLGQLLSIWTVFISDASKADTIAIPGLNLYANLFPGRVTSDHVMIHTTSSSDTICRSPLEYLNGQPLPGLMTLDSYLSSGGHDGVTGVKLLVCVKSIGARKRISRKKDGGESELAEIGLFDHTGEVRMTVWNEIIESAKEWSPGKTVLLISNPGFVVSQFSAKGRLGLVRGSMIDIEPDCVDGEWLRRYAAGLNKKESLGLAFPEGIWDEEASRHGVVRMLFTLAEIDNWVRADPQQVFSGFINIVVMEMSLVSLHRRHMLLCAECCGVPIYSNTLTTPCRNCFTPLTLSLNPRIFGLLLDETGCIAAGKLLWNENAWKDIFNRSVEEIVRMTAEECRLLEQRLLFMRMHLVIGWWEEVGRLAVLGMIS